MEIPLSPRLRALRTRKGYTQNYVSCLLGVERSTYTKYETAQATPPLATVLKLGDIFSVSIAYLCGETDRQLAILGYENPTDDDLMDVKDVLDTYLNLDTEERLGYKEAVGQYLESLPRNKNSEEFDNAEEAEDAE